MPRVSSGERPMLSPIRVRPRISGETMEPMSRLNYGKLYTIEHNLKVEHFGDIHGESLQILMRQFASTWRTEPEDEVDDENDEDDDEETHDDQEEMAAQEYQSRSKQPLVQAKGGVPSSSGKKPRERRR